MHFDRDDTSLPLFYMILCALVWFSVHICCSVIVMVTAFEAGKGCSSPVNTVFGAQTSTGAGGQSILY